MSMKNYGVKEFCFCLNQKDFNDVMVKSEQLEEGIDDTELAQDKGFDYIYLDDGEFIDLDYKKTIYNIYEEHAFVLYFDKDNLFDKYENKEDIVEEIHKKLTDENINLTKEFIEEHLGILEGTYLG